ncbi:hypothetical protein B484DRAFT_454328 [Ochromonadaceae sp. CCMP2298]|nr:hypothetical protein B484DRAFT_454328 [Ochromonadaceae sp. CCMP2298]
MVMGLKVMVIVMVMGWIVRSHRSYAMLLCCYAAMRPLTLSPTPTTPSPHHPTTPLTTHPPPHHPIHITYYILPHTYYTFPSTHYIFPTHCLPTVYCLLPHYLINIPHCLLHIAY